LAWIGETVKREHLLLLIAVALGAAIWIGISTVSGRREAWDSGIYFTLGIPVACLLSFALGVVEPERSWRWGVAPFAGQLLSLLIMEGVGNLLPLGVIVFAILSIPAVITARIGATLGTRRSA
jgi:hypothetical protein